MDEHLAMFSDALPVNPLPFLFKIIEIVREKGTDHIKSDEAKAMLWVVMAQSFGQLATIDLCEEWERLKKIFNQ